MTDPATSAVGGLAGWKALGGVAVVEAIAAGLAAIVVLCMTPPRHAREWVVGLISTIVGTVGGGSFVIRHFGWQTWALDPIGLVGLFGVAFACGLPAWALVRAVFTYLEANKDKGIDDIIKNVKDLKG